MAKIHVLQKTGDANLYNCVVHCLAPTGNNAANKPWPDVLKNAGYAQTNMTVGTGPGQIDQAEHDAIVGGTILEWNFPWQDDPSWTNSQRLADLDMWATRYGEDLTRQCIARLNYFGFARGTV